MCAEGGRRTGHLPAVSAVTKAKTATSPMLMTFFPARQPAGSSSLADGTVSSGGGSPSR